MPILWTINDRPRLQRLKLWRKGITSPQHSCKDATLGQISIGENTRKGILTAKGRGHLLGLTGLSPKCLPVLWLGNRLAPSSVILRCMPVLWDRICIFLWCQIHWGNLPSYIRLIVHPLPYDESLHAAKKSCRDHIFDQPDRWESDSAWFINQTLSTSPA